MCGVLGMYGVPSAAILTTVGLHHLHHRGQESAGITTVHQGRFHSHKRGGFVGDIFKNEDEVRNILPGAAAIGHVRYSTSGMKPVDHTTQKSDAQPFVGYFPFGGLALAHNGNLTNAHALYKWLLHRGCVFKTPIDETVDTEVALQLIGSTDGATFLECLRGALPLLEGAYAFIMLTQNKLIGVRDPLGLRPLSIGRLGGAYMFSSETCAIEGVHAEYVRDVEPGEIVIIENGMLQSHRFAARCASRSCIFESVYFARPDSVIHGNSVYFARKNLGRELAREAPVKADIVVPIPDSGVPAAMGYAGELGLPFDFGIVRNHYVYRTFIESIQRERDKRAILKSSPNTAVVMDKKLVLIDDSLVRGTTSKRIVQRLFEAGACEVHLRIASPPWRWRCHWGIDTASENELIAPQRADTAEVCALVAEKTGATSVAYLSIDGMYRAIAGETRRVCPQHCDACFTGDAPTPLTDEIAKVGMH